MTNEQKQEIDGQLTLSQICAARNILIMQRKMMGDAPDETVIAYLQEKLGNPDETKLVHPRQFYKNHKLSSITSGLSGSIKRLNYFQLT